MKIASGEWRVASGEWRVATADITIFVVIGAAGMLPDEKIASGEWRLLTSLVSLLLVPQACCLFRKQTKVQSQSPAQRLWIGLRTPDCFSPLSVWQAWRLMPDYASGSMPRARSFAASASARRCSSSARWRSSSARWRSSSVRLSASLARSSAFSARSSPVGTTTPA